MHIYDQEVFNHQQKDEYIQTLEERKIIWYNKLMMTKKRTNKIHINENFMIKKSKGNIFIVTDKYKEEEQQLATNKTVENKDKLTLQPILPNY